MTRCVCEKIAQNAKSGIYHAYRKYCFCKMAIKRKEEKKKFNRPKV
jgi:hypothetical protein